jgi:hypothetical protein
LTSVFTAIGSLGVLSPVQPDWLKSMFASTGLLTSQGPGGPTIDSARTRTALPVSVGAAASDAPPPQAASDAAARAAATQGLKKR